MLVFVAPYEVGMLPESIGITSGKLEVVGMWIFEGCYRANSAANSAGSLGSPHQM